MSARPARLPLLLQAAAGGALYFLGYVGFGVWPLLAVFLVPLWRAVERAPGPGTGALAGLAFGAVAYAGGYAWLWRLVEVFLGDRLVLGAALWTLHGLWFAAGFAAYAALLAALPRPPGGVALLGVPGLVALEWLQPQLFPVHAGAGLVHVAPLAQMADLGGPLLLSAFVGALNAVAHASWCWLRGERRTPWGAWSVAAVLVAVAVGYGELRLRQVARGDEGAPALRVGLVQANLGVIEKRTRAVEGHRRHLALSRRLLAEGPLDLLVWPETAYPHGLRLPLPVDGQLVRADLDVPLLFGGTAVREEGGRRVTANSALLVGPDGSIRDAYDKNLLIPLAERLPLAAALPWLSDALPHLQDFRAARRTPPLRLDGVRIATPICYEAIVAPFVRRMVREARPHLLVTLANDAWFGDSREPRMHLSLARLRAIEHRLWMVRATNSGISAIVDPAGRIAARTGLLRREVLRGVVHPREAGSVYTRVGGWPGPLAGLALVSAAALLARRRGAQRSRPATPRRATSARSASSGAISRSRARTLSSSGS